MEKTTKQALSAPQLCRSTAPSIALIKNPRPGSPFEHHKHSHQSLPTGDKEPAREASHCHPRATRDRGTPAASNTASLQCIPRSLCSPPLPDTHESSEHLARFTFGDGDLSAAAPTTPFPAELPVW